MRPVLGPVLSVVRAAAHAESRFWSHAVVRAGLGLSPAERMLAVPRDVTITEKDAVSRRRTERNWEGS